MLTFAVRNNYDLKLSKVARSVKMKSHLFCWNVWLFDYF